MSFYEYCPELVNAVKDNALDSIEELLNLKAPPNARDEETGKTVLMIAAENGFDEALQMLINARAFIDLTDRRENMAIHWAAFGGNRKCVEILLSKGSLTDVLNSARYSPLMLAILRKKHDVIKCLLQCDPHLIRGRNERNESELSLACSLNDLETVRLLLETDVPGLNWTEDVQIALHQAVLRKQTEVLKLLIELGADVNYSTEELDPIIFAAIHAEDISLISFLIQNGADVNSRDKEDKSVLMRAAARGLEDIVKILIAKGADVSASTDDGKTTALEMAEHFGHRRVADILEKSKSGCQNIDIEC
ncbi:hypothetical protein Aperf_G00000064423 [Anoplocephala perfoliata]